MLIFLFIYLIYFSLRNFYKLYGKVQKVKNSKIFNKNNLNNWMNLTKKERFDLSKEESINYLNKRKVLLKEIRKEYKKISKGNSKKT